LKAAGFGSPGLAPWGDAGLGRKKNKKKRMFWTNFFRKIKKAGGRGKDRVTCGISGSKKKGVTSTAARLMAMPRSKEGKKRGTGKGKFTMLTALTRDLPTKNATLERGGSRATERDGTEKKSSASGVPNQSTP